MKTVHASMRTLRSAGGHAVVLCALLPLLVGAGGNSSDAGSTLCGDRVHSALRPESQTEAQERHSLEVRCAKRRNAHQSEERACRDLDKTY